MLKTDIKVHQRTRNFIYYNCLLQGQEDGKVHIPLKTSFNITLQAEWCVYIYFTCYSGSLRLRWIESCCIYTYRWVYQDCLLSIIHQQIHKAKLIKLKLKWHKSCTWEHLNFMLYGRWATKKQDKHLWKNDHECISRNGKQQTGREKIADSQIIKKNTAMLILVA